MLFVLSLFIASSASVIRPLDVTVASAESVEAGVKAGDWIEYELNWILTPPPPYSLKIRREILAVEGSILTVRIVQEMDNGTIQDSTRMGDFINGTGAADIIFITPDLRPGDLVRSQGFGFISINGTDRRTYLETERTVLWAQFLEKDFDILVYWDKETGVALETHTRHISREGVTRIVAGNLWNSESVDDGGDEFILLGLGTLVLIVAMISTAVLLLRRKVSTKK